MKCIVIDLDGCLCDTREIRHFLDEEPKDFEQFYYASADCPVYEPAFGRLREAADLGMAVVIVTGREFVWRDLTLNWLDSRRVPYNALYMRQASDFRVATVVKRELLTMVEEDGYQPVEAWDDDREITELWRELGIAEVTEVTQ